MTLACNTKQQKQLGFTLLELLVVMSIMGVLLSFVAPMSLEKLENQQRRSAFDKISYWLNTQAEMAQINGCGNQFQFIGKQINFLENCAQYKTTDILTKQYRSEELSFLETNVLLNKHGNYTPSEITALYEGAQYVLNINTGAVEPLSSKVRVAQ